MKLLHQAKCGLKSSGGQEQPGDHDLPRPLVISVSVIFNLVLNGPAFGRHCTFLPLLVSSPRILCGCGPYKQIFRANHGIARKLGELGLSSPPHGSLLFGGPWNASECGGNYAFLLS